MDLAKFDYFLPEELIASKPMGKREEARLFVYNTKSDEIIFKHIYDLPELIKNSLIIYNDTKVLPARLHGVGETGKTVELLVLVDQGFNDDRTVKTLVNRFTPVGEIINVANHHFKVIENKEKSILMEFSGNHEELLKLLKENGSTPLPPYIKTKEDESLLRKQYQTTFASGEPSVAAPTASLHFTEKLITELKLTNNNFSPLTLQVGLGTFAPIFTENFSQKKLHSEFVAIPKTTAEAVKEAKLKNKQVMAVGTTVVRSLESGKSEIMQGESHFNSTDLFIFPPYHFSIADILMTNFHVPKSSLMCMVEAFLEDKGSKRDIVELYEIAIKERFRFYSFGDAMLII